MKSYRVVVTVAIASLCGLLLQPVAAQTLYKSTMPDGQVVYGDKPVPGAAKVDEIRPDTSKGGLGVTTSHEKEAVKSMEKDRLERNAQQDRVAAAEQALKNAEAARDAGKEPLEGERIGIVSAGKARRTRLTEAYYERQRSLEESVDSARRELDRARSGR